MSYQVIARKWRPQRFSDMVGQEHIARTLRNAIISGRIAHAYLFVGPRGIGKTTSARIFAKALNCTNPQNGEPCCECASCKAVANETNVDVIEIDAATHTQVEKARELCEDVLHLPINSKYKIKGFKIGRKNKELILFPMKEEFKDDQKDFPDLDLKLDAIIDRQKRLEHLIKELIKFIQPSETNPNNQLQSSYTLGVADIVGRTVQTPYR